MKKMILINLLVVFIFSQEVIDDIPVDTLLVNQVKILANQNLMMEEIIYIDPLEGKQFGVEINPAGFLISSTNDELIITGSVSLFSISKTAEIAFPIYYKIGKEDLKLFHLDSHYRLFTGKHRNGFYISSGVRFTQLGGREGYSFFDWDNNVSNEITSVTKVGLIFGIGYRIFGKNGWYWGTSLFAGRYFTDQEESIIGAGMADGKVIIDMELLKIGRTF